MSNFKEIGECRLTDTETAILSEMTNNKGIMTSYYINKKVESDEFTGRTKGIRIPEDLLVEFLRMFPQEALKGAINDESV